MAAPTGIVGAFVVAFPLTIEVVPVDAVQGFDPLFAADALEKSKLERFWRYPPFPPEELRNISTQLRQ
jgi:hypothetical protein